MRFLCKIKMKTGQSKVQQLLFKKKPCQRQEMQYSAGQSQSTRQGQVGQQMNSPEPDSTGQSRSERASEGHTSSHLSAETEHEWFLQKAY